MGPTSESSYILIVRSTSGSGEDAPLEPLRDQLLRVPQVAEHGPGLYCFGEQDEDGIMEIACRPAVPAEEDQRVSPATAGSFRTIEVRIPRPWILGRGSQVFALVFMMAEWCGWEVFDPQIGDCLQKDAVLQGLVAIRQARLAKEEAPAAPVEAYEPAHRPPPGPTERKPRKPWWKRHL